MKLNKLFLKLLVFVFCGFLIFTKASSQSYVDSLFKALQENKCNNQIKKLAFQFSYNDVINNLNKCLIIFDSIHQFELKKKNIIDLGKAKEKLALINYLKGNFEKSSQFHQQSILLFDAVGDKLLKANAMAEMAYQGKRRNLKASILTMREAISILHSINNKNSLAAVYDNFGVMHELDQHLDSALYYYNLALKLKRTFNDSIGIPYSLNNIAGVQFIQKNESEALKNIRESSLIRKKLKDNIGISWNEFSLGEYYYNKQKYKDAKSHFYNSLFLAQKESYKDLQARNFKYLSDIFSKLGSYDSAYATFKKFFNIHDSLYNEQSQKQILEMETRYETEKKSNQIKILNSDNKLKSQEISRKNTTQNFLLLIVLLVVVFLVFIFKAYLQKIKTNKVIYRQKLEVEFQKAEIEKQKILLSDKQKEILDSINYAKKIQDTILANKLFLARYLPNHFILFQPKDIVSGDFYWATLTGPSNDRKFYLAVCDSTGHGVPGAFMSLLNIGFINEAINEKGLAKPNEVFNYVRKRLVETISKGDQKDGFDGVLMCIDKNTSIITYAAANNAPVLIRDNTLIELPKDRMPVGKGELISDFTLQQIETKQGDLIYLYTDGYADQFGGPKGKKFKYRPLNDLLLQNHNMPLNIQSQELKSTFENWKKDLEQVDDVCIVGIKI